jgi:hypothetical protein
VLLLVVLLVLLALLELLVFLEQQWRHPPASVSLAHTHRRARRFASRLGVCIRCDMFNVSKMNAKIPI